SEWPSCVPVRRHAAWRPSMPAGRGLWQWKYRVSSCVLSPRKQHRCAACIVVQGPSIHFGLVVLLEVAFPGNEAAADHRLGYVVSALAHTFSHAGDGCLGTGQGQKVQLDAVALRTPLVDVSHI